MLSSVRTRVVFTEQEVGTRTAIASPSLEPGVIPVGITLS